MKLTAGGVRWLVAPEHRERLLGPHGLRLDEWLRTGHARPVKQGSHRVVYRVELPGLCCYLKHNLLPDARAWLRQLIRPSKARMEYERALAVAARRVPTVVPVALGERRDRPWPRDSFLVTHSLEDATPLNIFLETTLRTASTAAQTGEPGPDPVARSPASVVARSPAAVVAWSPPPVVARSPDRATSVVAWSPDHAKAATAGLPEAPQDLRQSLAVALGRFMARLHDAGVIHHDLHCGNILVRLNARGRPQLYLVDLQAVRLGRPLDWRASRDNLALLNRWLVLRTSRADRLRFWRAYCSARTRPAIFSLAGAAGRQEQRRRAREVEEQTQVSNEYFWRHRDRRCLETNRYFRPVRGPGMVGHTVTDLDPAALAALMADPDAPFRRPGVRLLKDSRSSTVAELELPVSGRPCPVIYKRFRVTALHDPWVNRLRKPAALRSWLYGNALRERGVPTARPLAVLHRRRHGLLYEGYLLAEKVPVAMDLRAFVDRLDALDSQARARTLRQRTDELARLIRDLHRRHLAHHDLKAANILFHHEPDHSRPSPAPHSPLPRGSGVGGEGVNPSPQVHVSNQSEGRGDGILSPGAPTPGPDPATPFWLIDLVGVTRHRRVPRRHRVQNLARLNASFWQDPRLTRTDRLRFLRVYLQWGFFGKAGWKGWWREIEQVARAKVARNIRRGRPLG